MIQLTDAQKLEDVCTRMEKFKRGMDALIDEHGIYPKAVMVYTEGGALPGINLSDKKYQESNIDNQARNLVYEKLMKEQGATDLVNEIVNEPTGTDETESEGTEEGS